VKELWSEPSAHEKSPACKAELWRFIVGQLLATATHGLGATSLRRSLGHARPQAGHQGRPFALRRFVAATAHVRATLGLGATFWFSTTLGLTTSFATEQSAEVDAGATSGLHATVFDWGSAGYFHAATSVFLGIATTAAIPQAF